MVCCILVYNRSQRRHDMHLPPYPSLDLGPLVSQYLRDSGLSKVRARDCKSKYEPALDEKEGPRGDRLAQHGGRRQVSLIIAIPPPLILSLHSQSAHIKTQLLLSPPLLVNSLNSHHAEL